MIQHLLTVFIHHCTIFLITCVFQNLDVISEVCSTESSKYHHFLPFHSLNVSLPFTLQQMLLFQSLISMFIRINLYHQFQKHSHNLVSKLAETPAGLVHHLNKESKCKVSLKQHSKHLHGLAVPIVFSRCAVVLASRPHKD